MGVDVMGVDVTSPRIILILFSGLMALAVTFPVTGAATDGEVYNKTLLGNATASPQDLNEPEQEPEVDQQPETEVEPENSVDPQTETEPEISAEPESEGGRFPVDYDGPNWMPPDHGQSDAGKGETEPETEPKPETLHQIDHQQFWREPAQIGIICGTLIAGIVLGLVLGVVLGRRSLHFRIGQTNKKFYQLNFNTQNPDSFVAVGSKQCQPCGDVPSDKL